MNNRQTALGYGADSSKKYFSALGKEGKKWQPRRKSTRGGKPQYIFEFHLTTWNSDCVWWILLRQYIPSLRITWLIRALICYPSAFASTVASNQIYRWCGSCIPEQVHSQIAHLNRQRCWNTAVRVTRCYHGIQCFMDTAIYCLQMLMICQNSMHGPNKRTIVRVKI